MEQSEGYIIAVGSEQENNRDKDRHDDYDDDKNHGTHYDEELAISSSFNQRASKDVNYASKNRKITNPSIVTSGGVDSEKNHQGEDVVGQLREQVRFLQNGLRQRTREGLEQQLRMATKLRLQAEQLAIYGPSMRTRLILAVLAGLLGWAPPLVLELHAAWTLWGCCRRKWNSDQKGKDTTAESNFITKTVLRMTFYLLISVVDFADGILDIIVSLQALLEDPCDDDDDKYLRKWSLLLFCMTLAGRVMGGVFGVFYESMDASDREATYFLVEVTVWFMEDFAALIYLTMKNDFTKLESANAALTGICAVLFCVSLVSQTESITNRLHPLLSFLFVLLYLSMAVVIVPFCLITTTTEFFSKESAEDMAEADLLFTKGYTIGVVVQLCVLLCWCISLYRNTKQLKRRNIRKEPEPFSELVDGHSVGSSIF